MKDKYDINLKVGDSVIINSYNLFTDRDTFERGVIEDIYTVTDGTNRTELSDVNIGRIVTCGTVGIIKER